MWEQRAPQKRWGGCRRERRKEVTTTATPFFVLLAAGPPCVCACKFGGARIADCTFLLSLSLFVSLILRNGKSLALAGRGDGNYCRRASRARAPVYLCTWAFAFPLDVPFSVPRVTGCAPMRCSGNRKETGFRSADAGLHRWKRLKHTGGHHRRDEVVISACVLIQCSVQSPLLEKTAQCAQQPCCSAATAETAGCGEELRKAATQSTSFRLFVNRIVRRWGCVRCDS